MKNKLYRITLATLFVAGLLLTCSQLQAAESSAEPVPPIGTFNDYEEVSWEEEVLEVKRAAARMEKEGFTYTSNYKLIGLINLALQGNALAAASLSDSYTFGIFPETLEDHAGIGDTPLGKNSFWAQYADELTSPGWAGYMADATDQRLKFRSGASKQHPSAYFWYINKCEGLIKYKDVHQIAYEGYAYAQADLSAAYSQAEGSSWVMEKEQNWIERKIALAEASAMQGEPYGLYVMGHNYLNGLYGNKPDPETALMYFLLTQKVLKQRLRPGALSHPDDDSIFSYGIHDNSSRIRISQEARARAEARADEWLADFIQKRDAAYGPVRERRAQLAVAMREKYRDEYIRVYDILKNQGIELPPSIF